MPGDGLVIIRDSALLLDVVRDLRLTSQTKVKVRGSLGKVGTISIGRAVTSGPLRVPPEEAPEARLRGGYRDSGPPSREPRPLRHEGASPAVPSAGRYVHSGYVGGDSPSASRPAQSN